MSSDNIWQKAKSVKLEVSPEIASGLDIGFDDKIPDDVKNCLRDFCKWAERNFSFPITLWVDFEYKHYLVRRDGKHVGYLFYWADFKDYPKFSDPNDIPVIRLPVRTEKYTTDEILTSFIEAISQYFAWLMNTIDEYSVSDEDVEEVLQEFLSQEATV